MKTNKLQVLLHSSHLQCESCKLIYSNEIELVSSALFNSSEFVGDLCRQTEITAKMKTRAFD
jgi:hypothetical protein